jgi:hypothetical protein
VGVRAKHGQTSGRLRGFAEALNEQKIKGERKSHFLQLLQLLFPVQTPFQPLSFMHDL